MKQPAEEQPMTRLQAQVRLGLFAPHDAVTLACVLGCWLGALLWYGLGSPSALQIALLLLISLNLAAACIIVLVYRALVFLLDISADVNLMPEASARIAVAYLQGRQPERPKPPTAKS